MRIASDTAKRREQIRSALYHLAGRASLLAPVQRVSGAEHAKLLVETTAITTELPDVCEACIARQPDPPPHRCLEERAMYLATLSEIDQAWALQWWMAIATAGQMPPAGQWDVWVAMRGRGAGKLLSLDTMVPTPSGWQALRDIHVGGIVFDEAGRQCRVTKTFDCVPDVAYRLTFSDHTTMDACAEHQWVTWTHADRKSYLRSQHEHSQERFPAEWPAWRPHFAAKATKKYRETPLGPRIRTTQEIVDTLTYGPRKDLNHCIPVCGALQLPEAELPIDPYVLGVWLGDGTAANSDITCHQNDQPHLRAEFESAGFKTTTRKNPQTVGVAGFLKILRSNGLLNNKHVPAKYLRGSPQQRLALLQGLMDTDGSADSRDRSNVEFCNTDKHLIDALVELARSLGQKPVVTEGRAKIKGVDYGPKWRATWRPTIHVFRLPRKAALIKLGKTSQSLRNHHRMIVSAERINSAPMRCLTVDSKHSMFLAGEGMIPTHNTWTGANQVIEHAFWLGPKARIGIFTRTSRSTDTETVTTGPSGIMTVSPRDFVPRFIPTRNRFEWPNGAQASLYTAEEPNQARGPEFTFIWADEVMNWERPETWHQLQFGLRNRHAECRIIATTTPTPSDFSRAVLSSPGTVVTTGSMFSNAHNLSPRYIKKMIETYGGTRRGRQELYGDMLNDAPGALWKSEWFEVDGFRARPPATLKQVVVAIDPAVTSKPDSDETGIIVAGLGEDDLYYVLEDLSGVYQAETWAAVAIDAYHHHQADCIIAEVNNGGDLVERNLRAVQQDINFACVRASRGKAIRAEPIAALYERNLVRHVEGVNFDRLEQQLCEWSPLSDARGRATKSPDRLDALVWALADLIDGGATEDGPGGVYGNSIDPNDIPIG